jgi:ribosomal-protein-alanine N-acetyltransferase
MGYYAFTPHENQGLMAEALGLAIADAFRRLRPHRLEANVQPGDKASRYLKIAGRWRDHDRWALLADQ